MASRSCFLLWLVACGGGVADRADGPGGGDDGGATPADGPAGGGTGIAADHPGDRGIAEDPRVLFADDFERYTAPDELDGHWDARYHEVSLTREADHVHAGLQAVQFTAPAQTTELSNGLAKALATGQDVVYLRYYSKFDETFDITGSSHNGADVSAHYFVDGNATPGIPADGTNKYLIAYEDWRGEASTPSPGEQNIYIYHSEQRSEWGDHFFPDGTVLPNTSIPGDFGPTFVPRPSFTPELGRWYAFEVMLQANTPGQRDGRVTCWVDGEIIADFPNLRLRDIDSLKIDRIGIGLHSHENPVETYKWYDDVVLATAYVGPMAP